jgi:hypothetical protein
MLPHNSRAAEIETQNWLMVKSKLPGAESATPRLNVIHKA